MRLFTIPAAAMLLTGAAVAQTGTAPQAGTTASPTSAAAQVRAGAAIVDATGAPVGTVTQVSGTTAVVDTGTNKVGVPVGNFAAGPNGLVLGNTRADLDAAATQAAEASAAQLKTLLVAGTDVHGTGGMVLGKVKGIDGEYVTVTAPKGGDVRLPVSGFAAGPNGLVLGLTSAQFDAAVSAVKK